MQKRNKCLILFLILGVLSYSQAFAAHDHSHSHHDHDTHEASIDCLDCNAGQQMTKSLGLNFVEQFSFSSHSTLISERYISTPSPYYKFSTYQSRAP